MTAALDTSTIPDDSRLSMVIASGAKSYPIASATWLLIYEQARDPEKGKKLVGFLKWTETEGQKTSGSLGFARLPGGLRRRVLAVIATLKF